MLRNPNQFHTGEPQPDPMAAVALEFDIQFTAEIQRINERREAAYIAGRRKLLGPAADIYHPDFPRPNLPSETIGISYRITTEPDTRFNEITREKDPIKKVVVQETIYRPSWWQAKLRRLGQTSL